MAVAAAAGLRDDRRRHIVERLESHQKEGTRVIKFHFNSLSIAASAALALGVVTSMTAGPNAAHAETYPSKPINWIVMWRAGGGTDSASRLGAKYLEKELGQKIVVQNITGGGGSIGYTAAKSARPDGYTLVTIQSDLPKFKPMKLADINLSDFEIIGEYSVQAPILVVRGDSKYKTLQDLIDDAKANPNKITVGVSDIGGVHHQPIVLLGDKTGGTLRAVAHEGSPQMAAGLLGGHVDAISSWVKQNASYVKDGKMRFLAYFGDERLPDFPDVPTVKELGHDIVWESPYGFGVPKGTPAEVKEVLSAALKRVWENPEFAKELATMGHVPVKRDGPTYQKQLESIEQDIAKIIKIMNP